MGPVEVLVPYIVKNELHRGAGVLGFVFAMGGLGAIGGALFMAHRGMPGRHVTFMYLSWTVATVAVARTRRRPGRVSGYSAAGWPTVWWCRSVTGCTSVLSTTLMGVYSGRSAGSSCRRR